MVGKLVPHRRRQRFVPREEFVAISRTTPEISPGAFRADLDSAMDDELKDRYDR